MKCCVPGCFSETGKGLKFNALPTDNERRREWLASMGRSLDWNPSKAIVCEHHFMPDDYESTRKDGSKKLKDSAVPAKMQCCVPGCFSKTGEGLSFNPLPKGKKRKKKWLELMGKSLDMNLPNEIVCELHFMPDDYKGKRKDGSKKLKASAVPSLDLVADKENLNNKAEHSNPRSMKRPPLKEINEQDIHNHGQDVLRLEDPRFIRIKIEHSYAKNFKDNKTDHLYAKKINDDSPLMQINSSKIQSSDVHKKQGDAKETEVPHDELSVSDSDLSNEKNNDCPHSAIITINNSEGKALNETQDVCNYLGPGKSVIEKAADELAEKEKENERLKKLFTVAEKVMKENVVLRRKLISEKKAKYRLQKRFNLVQQNVSKVLSSSQIKAMGQKSSRGVKWQKSDLECALSLKSRCGSTGYSDVAKRFIYPAVRTLNQRLEHIKFESGILDQVFDKMTIEIAALNEQEKNAMMALDEIALKPNDRTVDPSTKKAIGACTLPGHNGPANKALVFALGGLSTRWKQSVAYYFTKAKDKTLPKNVHKTGDELKSICNTLIMKSEKIGLKLHCVSSDMGSDNRAMWKSFGIKANAKTIVSSIPNPVRPDDFICFSADVPHVFKRMKLMFTKHKIIYLPDAIVKEFNLPSNKVLLDHVKMVVDYEKDFELKVAYRLQDRELGEVGQYEKMKMEGARRLFCHRTYVALELLSDELNPEMKTTAWFINLVNKWFDLMTSRSPSMALSLRNPQLYAERINHLRLTIKVFQQMKVGETGRWTPVQTGVLIATNSVLLLQAKLLAKLSYSFLLTARFTQDFLENIFSMIRSKAPLPTPLQFKYILRDITVSRKCCSSVRGSNYDLDEGTMLCDMLSYTRPKAINNHDMTSLSPEFTVPHLDDYDIYVLSDWELSVIYDMAGAALLYAVNVHKIRQCKCVALFLWHESTPHPFAGVTIAKNYTEGAQLEVSNESFVGIAKSEVIFRVLRDKLFESKTASITDVLVKQSEYVWNGIPTPDCHKKMKLWFSLSYFKMRLKQYRQSAGNTPLGRVALSSRSLGMRERTKNVMVKRKKESS